MVLFQEKIVDMKEKMKPNATIVNASGQNKI